MHSGRTGSQGKGYGLFGLKKWYWHKSINFQPSLRECHKKIKVGYDKFKSLLKGLNQIFEKNESNPEKATELIYQIAEIVYKEQKSPLEIRNNLNSKIEQNRILEDEIQSNELKLKSNDVTSEEFSYQILEKQSFGI